MSSLQTSMFWSHPRVSIFVLTDHAITAPAVAHVSSTINNHLSVSYDAASLGGAGGSFRSIGVAGLAPENEALPMRVKGASSHEETRWGIIYSASYGVPLVGAVGKTRWIGSGRNLDEIVAVVPESGSSNPYFAFFGMLPADSSNVTFGLTAQKFNLQPDKYTSVLYP